MRFFLKRFVIQSKCSYTIKIDGDWSDTDTSQTERLWQFFHFPVLWKYATAIVIISLTYSSSNIHVGISTSVSFSKLLNHLNLSFQFSSLDLWSWNIDKYFSSIKCSINHRIVWNPRLLAYLISEWSIIEIDNKYSNRNTPLPCYFLNNLGKHKLTHIATMSPWWKVACFKVVSSISKNHFYSNCNDFRIVDNNSTIIECSFMEDRTS
jgi:hypothetical protein